MNMRIRFLTATFVCAFLTLPHMAAAQRKNSRYTRRCALEACSRCQRKPQAVTKQF
jgi:hypothetical protein